MSSWLTSGLTLFAIGMGSVFIYLMLMIFFIQQASKVLSRFSDSEKSSGTTPKKPLKKPAGSSDDKALTAAVTAAIKAHNSQ